MATPEVAVYPTAQTSLADGAVTEARVAPVTGVDTSVQDVPLYLSGRSQTPGVQT